MPRPRPVYPEGMKKCSHCKELKPITEFSRATSTWDKLNSACKPCALASTNRWLARKREAGEYEEVKRNRREGMKRWREANLEESRDRHAKWKYGVEHGTYDMLLEQQKGRCKICGTDAPGVRLTRFHIDHSHSTGNIRGLLCEHCNRGLGHFKDIPALLRKAADYIEGGG